MRRLRERFGEQIEFVTLDWDDRSLDDFRARYGITGRTQYVMVSVDDEAVQRWFGRLDEATVTDYLQSYLGG